MLIFSSSLEVASFPEFVDEVGVLEIEQGRHPTVEMLDFVPNDTAEENRYKSTEAGSAFREQATTDIPDESADRIGVE